MPRGVKKPLHQALKHPNLNDVRASAGSSKLSVGGGGKLGDLARRQEVVVEMDIFPYVSIIP